MKNVYRSLERKTDWACHLGNLSAYCSIVLKQMLPKFDVCAKVTLFNQNGI